MAAKTEQQQVPLYLRVWLTNKCHVELTISGELSSEAFEKLAAFLNLTAEIWRPKEGSEEIAGGGEREG